MFWLMWPSLDNTQYVEYTWYDINNMKFYKKKCDSMLTQRIAIYKSLLLV